MSIQFILLPLFVQVVLTFVLAFWTDGARFAAVQPGDVALREPNWPKEETKIADAYHNQFSILWSVR
jgi:hypothetical protein